MTDASNIFEKHYQEYCAQMKKIDFGSIRDKLGIAKVGDRMFIPFFNKHYWVSGNGITDSSGNRPAYGVCVILSKYILLCPDQSHNDPEWVSFKDFKRISHFTNVNFFRTDTEQVILKSFSGKLDMLFKAGEDLGGVRHETDTKSDLSMQFDALPRISLLLLFNDRDEEFPASCSVLFQKHAEFYLDPESLAMMSSFLAKSLKRAIPNHTSHPPVSR